MKNLFAAIIGLVFSFEVIAVEAPSGSYQKHYDNSKDDNHWLILGAIERIKGAVSPEKELRVSGRVTEWLWQLPVGTSSQQAFDTIKSQVSKQSVTLFECQGRSCGASNDFANQVFEQSILYGRESSQQYWAGLEQPKSSTQTPNVWVLYATTRSNKRVYAYLEKVALKRGEIDKFENHLVQSETQQLMSQGYQVLPGAETKQGLSDEQIEWIKQLLQENPKTRFALVVHQGGDQEADSLIEASQQQAQTLVSQVAEANGFVKNLYAHGAGPMMPRDAMQQNRVELVRLSTAP